MARIAKFIDVDEPVDTTYEQWAEFERVPRCVVGDVEAHVRWRAEVLTFEPKGNGTRVTLRIDYDPTVGDAGLSRQVQGALETFKSFVEERSGDGWRGAVASPSAWRS